MEQAVEKFAIFLSQHWVEAKVMLTKLMYALPKVLLAIIGGLLALILSGDIKTDGTIVINKYLILKFCASIAISLTGGSAFIEYYQLQNYTQMSQGAIFLFSAVFGILIIGIVYQAVEMLKGKSFVQIVQEIKQAFFSMGINDENVQDKDSKGS